MVNRTINWDSIALKQFVSAIKYIAKDSIQNAEKVRVEILEAIEKLLTSPEMYPPDKFKTNNDGGLYRAFELHRYRVAYYIDSDHIRILRVRHTSREPVSY